MKRTKVTDAPSPAAAAPRLDECLAILRREQAQLEQAGVLHADVFGSVAHGNAQPTSDVDVLVELNSEAKVGLVEFVGIRDLLQELLGRDVDLISRAGLDIGRDQHILREAVRAF